MTVPATLEVQLEPVDPLLFGDNRASRAGEPHPVADQDPSPATLYGAIGARISHRLGARGQRDWAAARPVLGDFEPRLDRGSPERAQLCGYALTDADGRRWFPKPLHVRVEDDGGLLGLATLRPAQDDALSSLGSARRLTAPDSGSAKELEDELWVEESLLSEILRGAELAGRALGRSLRRRESFQQPEPRLGLVIDNATGVTVEGRLFARPYRRFESGVPRGSRGWKSAGYVAWYQVPGLAGKDPRSWNGGGFLGGDRRRVRLSFEPKEDPLAELRAQGIAAAEASRGYFAYLLTPAVAESGGFRLGEETPVAAAIGRPLWTSGWSGAAEASGPREMRTLLPAGSVFFFDWEGRTAAERRRHLEDRWLQPAAEAWRNAGFGRVLLGVWS
jgi:CRISPR type III-B/RAMP module-associated protein Cmr3